MKVGLEVSDTKMKNDSVYLLPLPVLHSTAVQNCCCIQATFTCLIIETLKSYII
jgi:hypothetical protein